MQMCWDLPGNPNAVAPPQVCSTQRLPRGEGGTLRKHATPAESAQAPGWGTLTPTPMGM